MLISSLTYVLLSLLDEQKAVVFRPVIYKTAGRRPGYFFEERARSLVVFASRRLV